MNKFNGKIKKVLAAATSIAVFSVSILPVTFAIASPVYAAPKLGLTHTVDKAQADRGDTLSYILAVKNTGTTDLTNVYILNPLHLADYVKDSGSYTRSTNGITRDLNNTWFKDGLNLGTVPKGTNVVVKYKAKVASNANEGDFVRATAQAKSDQTPKWVQARASTHVLLANPHLCAKKTTDKEVVSPGDTITYTIIFCNDGNVVLHDVLIFDRLDDRLDYVKGSTTLSLAGQTISIDDGWIDLHVNVGNVNPGQEGKLKFKVKVNDKAKDGDEIQNVGQLKSNQTPKWIQCFVLVRVKKDVTPKKEVGDLKIFKFEDSNADKVFNKGEKALSGFKFKITGKGIDKTVSTDADGVVVIKGLKPGTYTVSEIVPSGWRITTDNNIKVTVKADEVAEVRFGNKKLGKVLGKIKELPDTGPGLILLLAAATVPAGVFIKRLKTKI